MVKVTIVKKFRDSKTNDVYKPGQEVEFSKSRLDEINAKLPNYIKEHEAKKPSQSKTDNKSTKKQPAKKSTKKQASKKKQESKEDE